MSRRYARTVSRGYARTVSRRYIVIGAGAVGATVAVELRLAGIDVVVVARGANLAALRAGGLRYIRPPATPGGEPDERRIPLDVVGGPDEVDLRGDDVLVLATKSQDSEALLAQWAWRPVDVDGTRRTAAEALPVVLLQNGIENARTALRRFATVIDAVVLSPSSHVRPGEVVSPAAPLAAAFYLGRAPRGAVDDPTAEAVAADLRRASFAVAVVADIDRRKAGKLLGNLAYNLDAIYAPSELRDAAAAVLVEEARRQGAEVRFDDGDVESLSLPVDADALAILIRNLLENALEHGTGPVRVVISLAGDGGGAALMIENPTAQTAFVEAPFAKGPGSRGLGLGLSIVAALAAAMGASVDKTIRAGRARVVVRF